jgi:hypothetical protein
VFKKLALVHPWKVGSLFPLMLEFWHSFLLVMSDFSIPYSGVCFLEQNGGSTFCPQ